MSSPFPPAQPHPQHGQGGPQRPPAPYAAPGAYPQGHQPYGPPPQPYPPQGHAPYPHGGYPQPPQYPQPPKKKHTARNVVLSVIGVFLVIGIFGALFGEGAATDGTATAGDTAVDAADVSDADAAPKAKAESREAKAGFGDAVKDGKFTFVVGKPSNKSRIGDQYLGTKAQGVFLLFPVTITNHGDEAQTMFADNQYVFDRSGRKYSADSEAAIYLGEDSSTLWEEINPGNTVNGILVFDVPKGTKLTRMELHDSAFSGGVELALK